MRTGPKAIDNNIPINGMMEYRGNTVPKDEDTSSPPARSQWPGYYLKSLFLKEIPEESFPYIVF